eukprot:GHVO01051711.1.p1 GENE.GHVO01051711.1~~GHVO01051711.1.p1  ORF type:complete len:498 (-),score=84.81 GHVO01051711.1:251-1546(-)
MDIDNVLAACAFFCINETHIPQAHLRWTGGGHVLCTMLMSDHISARTEESAVVRRFGTQCMISAFIDAQKASFFSRIEQRHTIMSILEPGDSSGRLKSQMDIYARDYGEQFFRFVHLFVENMSWLLDESMMSLAEIKEREKKPEAAGNAQPSNAATDTENQEWETAAVQDEQQRNVSDMPFDQLERFCKSVTEGALRAVKVFKTVVEEAGQKIIASDILLTETVESLNCCLHHLVGAKCLRLKVSNFDKYGFKPRELLARICETYVLLNEAAEGQKGQGSSQNKLLDEMCNEERYFKMEIFKKAGNIIRREGIVSLGIRESFNVLNKGLQVASELHTIEEELMAVDDVPEEFLDPIMADIMVDPVRLPPSGTIMDRKHIERHLMSEQFDPFNRQPLTADELESLPDLKNRIQEYIENIKRKSKENARNDIA